MQVVKETKEEEATAKKPECKNILRIIITISIKSFHLGKELLMVDDECRSEKPVYNPHVSPQNLEEPAAESSPPDSTDDIITPVNQSGDNEDDRAGSEEAAEEVKKDKPELNKRCVIINEHLRYFCHMSQSTVNTAILNRLLV